MYKRYSGPYRICAFCQEEYEDFLRITEKGQDSPFYWHNREWVALWQTWIDYQQAMKAYGESPEFIDLVREVECGPVSLARPRPPSSCRLNLSFSADESR